MHWTEHSDNETMVPVYILFDLVSLIKTHLQL